MGATSSLAEYKKRLEEIQADLVDRIPADLAGGESFVESEVRYGTESGGGDSAGSPAWWQIRDVRTLKNAAGASEDVAAALGEYLVSEGWEQQEAARVGGSGFGVADQYRMSAGESGEWFVEIGYVKTTVDRAETLNILVVSPMTTRGETPPPNEFTAPPNE